MRFERFPKFFVMLLSVCLATAAMFGQSLTTGNISGTLFDPSHAVVPGASVMLKGLETGSSATTTTNNTGAYSFNLLKPGRYQISVKQSGFGELTETAEVQVGQSTTADLNLSVTRTSETVEVSGTAPLVNTEPSINTSFSEQEVAQLPSAGGDITNIADTAPGAVVNATGGYGNFTVNGLPATSNLFTVNGENDMDPYFNINNSGATNLTLGQNEVSEATIVTNAYGGQYGQLAGAQVTYVTKSGTNTFHGNAQYWWNGRYLNSNDWMNNNSYNGTPGSATPRPFANANQYAASFGGPVIKDHTFFFVDFEGLRFVLPNVIHTTVPSAAFASAVLANVTANQPAEASGYQELTKLWTAASAGKTLSPVVDNFCVNSDILDTTQPTPFPVLIPGLNGSGMNLAKYGFNADAAGDNCASTFQSTPSALAKEYILAFRIDQKLSSKDNLYFRYKLDHGTQPTYLDPVSSTFDALSPQPAYDLQVNESHLVNSNSTNAFTASLSHYVAQFQQGPQALQTLPFNPLFSGSVPFTNFNPVREFPQGRNITQYQFIDDFSWTHGSHTWKFGANYRRYDVSDHNFFYVNPAVYWGYNDFGLFNFADGYSYQYRQASTQASNVPVALWGLGVYGQDEWKATHNLKLTLALRVERNSNPVCQINCFANFKGEFSTLPSYTAALAGSDPGNVNYSSDIAFGQHQAYQDVDKVAISPRIGFSWDPRSNGKTVISGGIGLFYDNPAAGVVDNLLTNPPVSVTFRVRPPCVSAPPPAAPCGALSLDPSGAPKTFSAAAAAFNINSNYNAIQSALTPLNVVLPSPAVSSVLGKIKAPQWTEYNLSIQQELNRSTVLLINYVGNHGARIPYENYWPNAFDLGSEFGTGCRGTATSNCDFFNGAVNPNFGGAVYTYGSVTQTKSGAISNYNGLTVSLRKQFSHWIAAHANYTWSHNMDELSNGGIFTYGDSILAQLAPNSLRADNYGNSDYDIRHLFNADFVINPEFHANNKGLKWIINGWQFSGKMFWRTGLPYSITDNNLAGTLVNNADGIVPAQVIGNVQPRGCGSSAASVTGTGTPCLVASALLDTFTNPWANTGFPTQRRNQYLGPHFFDMDLNLFKNFKIGERLNTSIGIQAFNAFNHPNFGLPDNGFGDGTFGQISTMTGTPTSPYGNFLGFDSSVRVVQLSAKVVF
jgi:hypothetical protein